MSVDEIRARLLARAFLFDDPETYSAGIEDALGAVSQQLKSVRRA